MVRSKAKKYGFNDIYNFYKKNAKKPVDKETFRSVWSEFAESVTDSIVEGKDFLMPFKIGFLGIRKHKIKVKLNPDGSIDKRYLRPDWKATKELWKKDEQAKERKQLVFHLNKHFNGYNCKWHWDKKGCRIVNQTAYSLVMTRQNKRKLAKAIFEGEVDYYEQKPKIYQNGRNNKKDG